ncbi:MAG: ROK family protein [Kiritimatiellia bacterium]
MGYSIGLDIGGTKCAVSVGAVTNAGVEIRFREEFPTAGKSWQEVLAIYTDKIQALSETYAIANIGISCGGPLDSKAGLIQSPPNLPGWDNVPIVQYFTDAFNVPVHVQNDANACALAEAKYGAGRGARNVVFMTFGTGLGAGIVIDGRLYSGTNDNAGEIGHIRLAPRGPKGYNKDGSAEGFCSGAGIARLAGIRAREHEMEYAGSESAERARAGALTTKDIFGYVRAGDAFCTRVFKESAEKLATLLAYVIDILNPEVIVLGGVFMRNADLFMGEITPILEREALPGALRVCRIVPAGLSENIGDYAALAVAAMGDEK